MNINEQVHHIVERSVASMGLERWDIALEQKSLEEDQCRAGCNAMPEYRQATIVVDADRLQTGDDLQELVVHEMAHCHVWPIHALADQLALALAESAPKSHRKALRKLLCEEVRLAAEATTTDVGHTYLRLLRRAGVLDTPPTTD